MYTTYIRFKNLLFIHPRNPFYIERSICAVKNTLRKMDHKTWMLKVRIVFGNIKYVNAYDL